MSSEDILRLWKDPVGSAVADHPAGRIDLPNHLDQDMVGGTGTAADCTVITSLTLTYTQWGTCALNTDGCCATVLCYEASPI